MKNFPPSSTLLCQFSLQVPEDGSRPSRVWDLDTTLPFPYDAKAYVAAAFRPFLPWSLQSDIARRFRVVSGRDFLDHFASDRSHMMRPDHTMASPAPDYPCIASSCVPPRP